jgi:fatty acid-binding protein DegV
MVELNVSMSENNPEAYLTIGQCDSQSLVDQISEPLKLRLGLSEIPVFTAPPAIIVHVGPGLVVTSGFSKS